MSRFLSGWRMYGRICQSESCITKYHHPPPNFIVSDMSDNDVPIGNDNVEEAEGRIEFLTVQLSIHEIYVH